MNEDYELLTSIEDLQRQIGVNQSQLFYLYAVARANTWSYFLAILIAVLLCILGFVLLGTILFSGPWMSSMNQDLRTFAGPVSILSFAVAYWAGQAAFSAWFRASEARAVIREQENAIEFAESVLRDNGGMNKTPPDARTPDIA
jgi:hypothetical protein